MTLIELSILGIFDVVFYIIISGKIANQYKQNKKLYIIPVVLTSFVMGIVGTSSIANYTGCISVIVLILLTISLYKRDIKEIVYIYLLSMSTIILIQYLVLFILKIIKINIGYNFRVGFIAQIMAFIITLIVKRYITIDILFNYVKKKNTVFKYLIWNISIILLSLTFYWYIDINGIIRNIVSISGLILGMIYINFILMKDGLRNELEQQQLRTYELYLPIIDELINELRVKQHEYDNHIQSLNMIAITSVEEQTIDTPIKNYINSLDISYSLGDLIKLNNKILVGFLYSKIKSAEKLYVDFQIIIDDYEFKTELQDYELIEIIGNLINNAFETMVENNIVIVRLSKKTDMNVIEVRNKHSYLKGESINNIFNMGVSTKSNSGRGYGLYNVYRIVKKYSGEIQVFNEEICEENYIVFKVLFRRN